MLITFKSKAAPDIIMLNNLAQFLLSIIGKQLDQRGVISHDELAQAIARLEAAIHNAQQKEALARAEHQHDKNEASDEIPVGLAQRAFPLLDMMRTAHQQDADIIWGI
ncbi:DUF1840 domain-containing protein [Mycoavidus sp. B2-EB]|uniref:DUF1840 domain-containing protein n=1 Tax=Mycoavidus sp. B2-EB TaxID=2651972 RepID=UPI0016274D3B|nr:DUF1840 domain-containing protein [Mycoavidus sp. B2-EB]BBO60454.1 hypothetical protein MPB2EB_1595 [Mycoavidus sp. B2-EB]